MAGSVTAAVSTRPRYFIVAWILTLSLLGAVSCTVPPVGGAALPACPGRQLVHLEPADAVNFSIGLSVSENGSWLVKTRVVGNDTQFSISEATSFAPAQVIGSLPSSTFGPQDRPISAVAPDGSWALFGERGGVLMRWTSATGTALPVTSPTVANPPPGTPYPTFLDVVSEDGERAVWLQSFYVAPSMGNPSEWNRVRTVTDTVTDATIHQFPSESGDNPAILSTGGHYITTPTQLVSVDTNVRTSFAPAIAQLGTEYPGNTFASYDTSDNGRFTVFQRIDRGSTPGQNTWVLWDSQTASSELIWSGTGLFGTAVVGNDGRLLYLREVGSSTIVRDRAPGGSETTVLLAELLETSAWQPFQKPLQNRFAVSEDMSTVVSTEIILGSAFRLQAHRCQ